MKTYCSFGSKAKPKKIRLIDIQAHRISSLLKIKFYKLPELT